MSGCGTIPIEVEGSQGSLDVSCEDAEQLSFDLDDGLSFDLYLPGPPGPPGSGGGSSVKAGVEAGASFTGTPKKLAVTFGTPFSDANYTVTISAVDSRIWSYESKTAAGFTINANASTALSGEVSWMACPIGS